MVPVIFVVVLIVSLLPPPPPTEPAIVMISMMMRMLHPHLAPPRKPLGARFFSAAAWHLLKNSLPHLFSSLPTPSSESDLNPPPSPSPNLVLVVHGIGPQVKVQHDVAQ